MKLHRPHTHTARLGAILLLLVLMLPLLPLSAVAEEKAGNTVDYRAWLQTVYSKDNGLACGSANDVATTSDGLLWIGTYAGLYRANGSEFRLMNEYASVKNVNALYVDDTDRLLVGTNDSGLSMFLDERLLGSIDKNGGLPSDSVRSIVKAADGRYYVGTADSLVILTFDGEFRVIKTVPEVQYAARLTADGEGRVAAVTAQGTLFLLKDGTVLHTEEPSDGEDFSTCFFDTDGTLCVGSTEGRVIRYRLDGNALAVISEKTCAGEGEIQRLYRVDENTLFVCADNGIGYFTGDADYTAISNTAFNNSVDNMTVDYQGNLWFSSSRLGLMRLCSTDFYDLFDEYAVPSAVVNTVEQFDGLLYVGTDTGLVVLDEASRRSVDNIMTETLAGVRIRQILRAADGTLWFCTYGKGLVTFDGTTPRFFDSGENDLGSRVRTIMQKKDGTVVVSGDAGIAVIRDGEVKKRITVDDGLPGAQPLCLLEGTGGSILAGTDGGGIARISESGAITIIGKEKGLPSEVVLRMVRDTAGDGIFVVTSNSLGYLRANDTVTAFKNFPYSNNFDLLEQDGRLLVLGSAGIYAVDREALLSDDADMKYSVLDSKVGLLHSLTANAWVYHDAEARRLYLPTNSGVTAFDMNAYRTAERSYRIRIAEILVDGKPLDIDHKDSFSFPSGVKKLEIKPEIINFSISNPTVSFRLEGFDAEPIYMEQSALSTLVYTNLPAGHYTFHMAVVDAQTGETVEEKTYVMDKPQAFYESAWFIVLLVVCLTAASVFIGVRITRARYNKKLEEQEKALELTRRQIEMSNETIMTIANAVESRDSYTSRHSNRVAEYSVKIARKLGYNEEQCENLQKIAKLHDIGKIGIPDSVLNKPGRLTDEEYATMKTHVTAGAKILQTLTFIDHVDEGARYHHERYDGRGYPNGLSGEEIPVTARIIGVADAFDAMTSNRIYRNALDMEDVLAEIRRCSGAQFDPKIAEILISLVDSGEIDPTRSVKLDGEADQ